MLNMASLLRTYLAEYRNEKKTQKDFKEFIERNGI